MMHGRFKSEHKKYSGFPTYKYNYLKEKINYRTERDNLYGRTKRNKERK
jgi:hypothetical protein